MSNPVVVVDVNALSIQTKDAKRYSSALRSMSVPHRVHSGVIRFHTFRDMRVLLNMMKVKVKSPSTATDPLVKRIRTLTRKVRRQIKQVRSL